MSPLLTTRAPVSVNLRLLAACAVTAALAILVALGGGAAGNPTSAVPAALAVGCVCAAVVGHLLHASARAAGDPRLLWVSAGVTLAFLGLLANLLGQPSLFPGGGPVSQGADAMTARYLIWHGALAAAGLIAVAGVAPTLRRLIAFAGAGVLLLGYASIASAPFGDLAPSGGGYVPAVRIAVAALAIAQLGAAAAWWRKAGGAPTWAEMCVIAALGLSGGDALAYAFATDPYAGAWWASLTLRAGQFAVPAVGLVIGFIAVADRLRELQDELGRGLELERRRAERQEAVAGMDRRHREQERARIDRLIDGEGLDVALQPIVDLLSRRVVGAEALARFTDPDGQPIPTEQCFLDAHALGVGPELELAVVRLALACEGRLPEGLYLALNVSPALLGGEELERAVALAERPIVVELTEHQAVEDYAQLGEALDRLRAHGVRVAVDDVGSGFASFRHVTRVNPEILKLDRTLVCGIDEDPVRQSLAAAIADRVAPTASKKTPLSEDQIRAAIGAAFFALATFYVVSSAVRMVKAARGG
jgi:EAL domain-containing protein (putative c-di-GMP-specific phosphodiesterase class I)